MKQRTQYRRMAAVVMAISTIGCDQNLPPKMESARSTKPCGVEVEIIKLPSTCVASRDGNVETNDIDVPDELENANPDFNDDQPDVVYEIDDSVDDSFETTRLVLGSCATGLTNQEGDELSVEDIDVGDILLIDGEVGGADVEPQEQSFLEATSVSGQPGNFTIETTEVGLEDIAKGFKENLWLEAVERANNLVKGEFISTDFTVDKNLDWTPEDGYFKDKIFLKGNIHLDPKIDPRFHATWSGKLTEAGMRVDADYDLQSEIIVKPLDIGAGVRNVISVYDTGWQNRKVGGVFGIGALLIRHRLWVEASYEITAKAEAEVSSSARVRGSAFFETDYDPDSSNWTYDAGEGATPLEKTWAPPAFTSTDAFFTVHVTLKPHLHVEIAGQKFRTDINGRATFDFKPEAVMPPALRMNGSYEMLGESWVDWKHTGSKKLADITVLAPQTIEYLCELAGAELNCSNVAETE